MLHLIIFIAGCFSANFLGFLVVVIVEKLLNLLEHICEQVNQRIGTVYTHYLDSYIEQHEESGKKPGLTLCDSCLQQFGEVAGCQT